MSEERHECAIEMTGRASACCTVKADMNILLQKLSLHWCSQDFCVDPEVHCMHDVKCNLAVSLLQPLNLLHATVVFCIAACQVCLKSVWRECATDTVREINADAMLHCQLGSH